MTEISEKVAQPTNLQRQPSLSSEITPSVATGTSFADEKADKTRTTGDVREPTIAEEDEFMQDAFTGGREKQEDYIEFRTMGWIQAAFVCLAEVCSPQRL